MNERYIVPAPFARRTIIPWWYCTCWMHNYHRVIFPIMCAHSVVFCLLYLSHKFLANSCDLFTHIRQGCSTGDWFCGSDILEGFRPILCTILSFHFCTTFKIFRTSGKCHWNIIFHLMMTSSNGNIFRVTGPLCGEFTGPGEFPAQRPVTRSFDVFFDWRLNKRSSKQPRGWW